MIDLLNFNKIGDNIHVKKNFINKEEIDILLNLAYSFSEEEWADCETHYVSKNSEIKEIKEIFFNKLNSIVFDELILDKHCYFQKYKTNQGMSAHQDDNKVLKEIELSKIYKDGMKYKTVNKPEYGVILYLQKTNGGDIIYPNQNITFSPEPGDLLIHCAQEICTHFVTKLLDGTRIIIPSYIYKEIKVPV
jgi:hypothetical protein